MVRPRSVRIEISDKANNKLHGMTNRQYRRAVLSDARHRMKVVVSSLRDDAIKSTASEKFGVLLQRYVVQLETWLLVVLVQPGKAVIEDFIAEAAAQTNPIYRWLFSVLDRRKKSLRLVGIHLDNWSKPNLVRVFGLFYRGTGPLRVLELLTHRLTPRPCH